MSAVMSTYARYGIAFERGEGIHLYGTDGRRYLDFAAGVAVVALGHCHPRLVEALTRQARALWHCSNIYRIPGQERLAERLAALTFADAVFFCNSGAEAMEGAIKLARKYQHASGRPGRYRVICCTGAFHGRTLATIAAGGQQKHLAGFEPTVEGFDHVAYNNLNEMRAAITDETAAILVEPVQGEGGLAVADAPYLTGLRRIADEFGVLLVFDEVQCGMGRTGRLFAHEWAGVAPDIMGIAKGLGGGFPVGAFMATARVAAAMTAGSHGSTFGGNPLAMAVANAVLDEIAADGFLARVERAGDHLARRLKALAKAHPAIIAEARGKGLLAGFQCRGDSKPVVERLMQNGLLTVPAGDNVVRTLPPLIVTEADIDEAAAIIDRSCRELAGAMA